jgi:hypothetical protein
MKSTVVPSKFRITRVHDAFSKMRPNACFSVSDPERGRARGLWGRLHSLRRPFGICFGPFQPISAAAARAFAATGRLTARIIFWANACHSTIALALSWPRTRERAGRSRGMISSSASALKTTWSRRRCAAAGGHKRPVVRRAAWVGDHQPAPRRAGAVRAGTVGDC